MLHHTHCLLLHHQIHHLNRQPIIRGGIPTIHKDCDIYFVNHRQVIIDDEINYRLQINIYDEKLNLKDYILFDSIYNERIEYPTSAFIMDENIFISFGIDDKNTNLYKFNLYDMIVNENPNYKNNDNKEINFTINSKNKEIEIKN